MMHDCRNFNRQGIECPCGQKVKILYEDRSNRDREFWIQCPKCLRRSLRRQHTPHGAKYDWEHNLFIHTPEPIKLRVEWVPERPREFPEKETYQSVLGEVYVSAEKPDYTNDVYSFDADMGYIKVSKGLGYCRDFEVACRKAEDLLLETLESAEHEINRVREWMDIPKTESEIVESLKSKIHGTTWDNEDLKENRDG